MRAGPARHHSPEEGNEQAGSNRLGRESTPHATLAQCTLQPIKPITKAKPRTQHMFISARDPLFGDGHEQAKHVMGQTHTKSNQKNPDDREMLQKHTNAPTTLQLSQTGPWGKRNDQAPALGSECATPTPRGRLRAGWQQQPTAATRIYAPCHFWPRHSAVDTTYHKRKVQAPT